MSNNYANGKGACVGDTVVGIDTGGNYVSGVVVGIRPDGLMKIMGVPMMAKPEQCLRGEDALATAMSVTKAAQEPPPTHPV